ncbi:putative iron-regulated membrane protein [Providencia alcalifaciens]|nr:putative iron-regulated membrane protein [Providencia alcalifaciens]
MMALFLTRRTWLKIHLWLGLVIGFFIAILGVSGSLLLLKKPILEWEIGRSALYASPHSEHSEANTSAPDLWRQSAQQNYPQLIKIIGVALPETGFIPATNVMVFGKTSLSNKLGIAFIDPIDASAKGFVIFDDLIFSQIVSLHSVLLLPQNIGSWLVLSCGVVLTLSLISGVILWWPKKGIKSLFSALIDWHRGLKGAAKWRQWHYFVAIYLTIPLFVITLSGILLSRPELSSLLSLSSENKRFISQLHSELGLGFSGLIIAFLSGFVLPLLYVSGVIIWWKKRPHRRSQVISTLNRNAK